VHRRAFTLIELLIVVAIIAILAAIAVPNFLEAQTRAKISRVRADARTAATALEAYAVDFNTYPPNLPWNAYTHLFIQYAYQLSTPIAYLSSTDLTDPFIAQESVQPPILGGNAADWRQTLYYFTYDGFWSIGCYSQYKGMPYIRKGFCVFTNGPARNQWSGFEHIPFVKNVDSYQGMTSWANAIYDATNGTVSPGGIGRFGGELEIEQTF